MSVLYEKTLVAKLFYQNQQNSIAAVKEFRCMKQMQRGPMSPCALCKMIQIFGTAWKIRVLLDSGERVFRLLE